MALLQQFQQFALGMNPQDAKAKVEQMVQSGQVSQDQLNQAMQMVKPFASMLSKFLR